jgi:hypothetical protein
MKYLFLCLLLMPILAQADMVITEVMYDLESGSDSGREWVEVHNSGPSTVTLPDWKVFENGANHKISAIGDAVVAPGAYAVIADNPEKFKNDWPAYSGLLFDSAFSLSNEGETLILRDSALRDASSAVFSSGIGGNGSGDSLQRASADASFSAGVPTPGSGIPAGGLVRSPIKTKSAKTTKAPNKDSVSALAAEDVRGEVPSSQVALVSIPVSHTSLLPWFLGVFVLSGVGAGGIVWAQHLKKDEWEIIEEIEETS